MADEGGQTEDERVSLLRAFREGAAGAVTIGAAAAHLRAHWPATVEGLAADDLLAELLVSVPIYPAWLERRMTELRQRLLTEGGGPAAEPLLANLAIQCQLNEYAWAVEPAEQGRVDGLAARVETLTPSEVMVLACYAPLARLPGADLLMGKVWSGPVRTVLQEQIGTVRREQALQVRIQALTPIRDEVSGQVRAQYEASPYPRWRRVTPVAPVASIFGWPVPKAANVLFAGCGTGYHAIHAGQRYAGAKMLAVDLSRASLGYALRKTREAGIANLGFAQADLLELGSTGLSFDVIECSGVLHHLADPFEGARVLAGLLRPGGVMKLGLYSATARRGLKAAKVLAKSYTPGTVRALRQAIVAAPEADPVKGAMRFSDFYAASSCRDLLMHVQEHEMEIADLARMIGENGLRFLGFTVAADVRAAYRQMFPDDPGATDLDRWAEFERRWPMTFGGMYQFWVHKPG
ncbi:class I SAM-dependent methyltransferase [Phenylobacterium sp.]|uniref:class I SAM-dependent methyltransferase n=1 Tax=Phenylobacterium sp. TaxID=1871053 RepID=UPI0025E6F6A6|nr:class I SAM-dependent methyltransferase [Phenylobacterium sp.]